jgi:hypothetical protein
MPPLLIHPDWAAYRVTGSYQQAFDGDDDRLSDET